MTPCLYIEVMWITWFSKPLIFVRTEVIYLFQNDTGIDLPTQGGRGYGPSNPHAEPKNTLTSAKKIIFRSALRTKYILQTPHSAQKIPPAPHSASINTLNSAPIVQIRNPHKKHLQLRTPYQKATTSCTPQNPYTPPRKISVNNLEDVLLSCLPSVFHHCSYLMLGAHMPELPQITSNWRYLSIPHPLW